MGHEHSRLPKLPEGFCQRLKFVAFQHGNICKICEGSKVASLFLKILLPKIPELSLRLALFMDNLGEIPFPKWVACG